MSPGKDQGYFADGLSEELLNLLAKVPGLRVAARTSSFAFKGKSEDVAQIGQKLHVAHILEGSVRKAGDQIRITDVFAVQDEIAKAVVSALKLQLLSAPGSKERRTTNAEAHDLYLKGLFLWNQRSSDALLRAADFFREAIRADPGYALAYVGLADAIQVRTGYAWIRSSELGAQAKAAALHALDHYRKAIALRPNYATAHQWYAGALSALGRAAEARQEIELAMPLDPTSRVIHANAGQFAMEARDYPRAERHYRAALDLAPEFQTARSELAMVYAREGKRAEALAELQKISPLSENR
jgi:tetratricopeptide (TPR) repeat protein